MGFVYYVKINKIDIKKENVILYIQLTSTGAGEPWNFPEDLKTFFLMTLYYIDKLDFYNKKNKFRYRIANWWRNK